MTARSGFGSYDELLEASKASDSDDALSMPWLEAYRKHGAAGLDAQRAEEARRRVEADANDAAALEVEESGADDLVRPGDAHEHGGSSGAVGATQSSDAPADVIHHALPDGTVRADGDAGDTAPASLQLTDHQDAVQQAATATSTTSSRTGGAGGDGAAVVLPRTSFKVTDAEQQPQIKRLPEQIIARLREQLRASAVRELGVDDETARDFSDRLSNGSLVTAFLIAQLDLAIAVDASTEQASRLFRSVDPLLGAIVSRLDAIEQHSRVQGDLLQRSQQQMREVRETGLVVEQGVGYLLADRVENLGKGVHLASELHLLHPSVIQARDRAREQTSNQQRLERDRDGRPIR